MFILKSERVQVARNVYANAQNAGVRYEALAILETLATYYNPTTKASENGDLYANGWDRVQVKAHDGRPAFTNEQVTGDLLADAITAITADCADVFMIWQSETQYIRVPKAILIEVIKKDVHKFIRYAPCDKGTTHRSPLRFQIGITKNKYFAWYGIKPVTTAVKGLL